MAGVRDQWNGKPGYGNPISAGHGAVSFRLKAECCQLLAEDGWRILKTDPVSEWHTRERARGAMTAIAGVDFPASVKGFRAWYRESGLAKVAW